MTDDNSCIPSSIRAPWLEKHFSKIVKFLPRCIWRVLKAKYKSHSEDLISNFPTTIDVDLTETRSIIIG